MGNSPQKNERKSEVSRLESSLRPLEHNKIIGNMLKKAHVKMDTLNHSIISGKKMNTSQMNDTSYLLYSDQKGSVKQMKKNHSEINFVSNVASQSHLGGQKVGDDFHHGPKHSRNMSTILSRDSDFQEFSRESFHIQKENLLNSKVMNPKQNSENFKKRFMNLDSRPSAKSSKRNVFSNNTNENIQQRPSMESSCELSFVEDAISGERLLINQKEIQRKQINFIGVARTDKLSDRQMLQQQKTQQPHPQQLATTTYLQQSPQGTDFINVNCNFEESLFNLPSNVVFLIISFLIDEYSKLELISPVWYLKVNEVLEEIFLPVDNDFIMKNIEILSFKKAFFSFTPQLDSHNHQGYRIDRNIVAEVLPQVQGKTITLGYTYTQRGSKNSSRKLYSEFKFDAVKEGSRLIWIYKEECQHNFDETGESFLQSIMPVCVNHNIKIALNFFNLVGLVDISSIKWVPPRIDKIPTMPKSINSKVKLKIDKNRICEIEDLHSEWCRYEYFDDNKKVMLDSFTPQLNLKDVRCAGVGIVTSKMTFVVAQVGEVPLSQTLLGIKVVVLGNKEETTTDLKKQGLYTDLNNRLELRTGDVLVFYLSRGD